MKITADLLRSKGACKLDIEKFEKEWPDGCEPTKENCIRAFCELKMNPNWAADELLSGPERYEYCRRESQDWGLAHSSKNWPEYRRLRALAFYEAAKMEGKEKK